MFLLPQKTNMKIIIETPEEFNPIELIRLAQSVEGALTYKDLAIAFACSQGTIAKWMCGYRKPAHSYWLWAGELKKKWNL